jgi:repressor LexA
MITYDGTFRMIDFKEERCKQNLTQKQVADMVGVSEATISRYESGCIKNMRSDKVLAYAKALNVDPKDLINTLWARV